MLLRIDGDIVRNKYFTGLAFINKFSSELSIVSGDMCLLIGQTECVEVAQIFTALIWLNFNTGGCSYYYFSISK